MSLILFDSYLNYFQCDYVNHDNYDKNSICYLNLMHICNQTMPIEGTILFFHDNLNNITYEYIITQIFYSNDISLLCKLSINFYPNSPNINYFAHINYISQNNIFWSIKLEYYIQPIFDYFFCRLYTNKNKYIIVALEKSKHVFNTFIIRALNKSESKSVKKNKIYTNIYLINNNISFSNNGISLLEKWSKQFNFHNYTFQTIFLPNYFNNLIVNEQNYVNIIENTESIDENIIENTESIDENIIEKVISVEENIIENIDSIDKNVIEKVISVEEYDPFYDGYIMPDPNNICYINNKYNIKNIDIKNDELNDSDNNLNNNIENILIKKSNSIEHKKNKKQKQKLENTDDIINIIYLFDTFYDNYIINDTLSKNIIYDKYIEFSSLYEKILKNKSDDEIFEFISKKLMECFPSILKNTSYEKNKISKITDVQSFLNINNDKNNPLICDKIQNKELEKIIFNKNDDKILIPYIKEFNKIFGDVFNHLNPSKKKILLLYYSFSVKNYNNDNLNEYFKIIPSILFRNKDGIVSENGYCEEEKIVIFHMSWLLNTLDKYIIYHLFQGDKIKNTIELINFLNRLLFQYFSPYIVHNNINAILIVPKYIFSNYVHIITLHIHYLFPDFNLKKNIDENILNYIKTENSKIDKFILKSRIMVSNLLVTLDESKYYIATGYISKFVNDYFYNKNNDSLNKYILEEKNLEIYFEKQLHIQFEKVVKLLDK